MSLAIQGSYSDRYASNDGSLVERRSNTAGRPEAKGGQESVEAAQSGPDRATAPASKAQSRSSSVDPQKLTKEQKAEVAKLEKRDTEVRVHEQAHVAAGGQYVRGGANLEYTTGPDGRQYAVGGEVSIDTSPVPDDPRATILKMETIKRAALAPAQPSSQDRTIAATADRTATAAVRELAAKALEEQQALASGNRPAKGTFIALTV